MGVYSQVTIKENGVWNTFCGYEMTNGIKPAEFGYVGNDYIGAMMLRLLDAPKPLIFLTDYSENETLPKWEDCEEVVGYSHKEVDTYNYILNHTKQEFIVMEKLKEDADGLIVHPLAMLCHSDKESLGGGDFYDTHELHSQRTLWAGDTISVTSHNPPKEFTEKLIPNPKVS